MKLVIKHCLEYLEDNIKEDLSVELIARHFSYSKHHFSRLFKSETGFTIKEYILNVKMHKAVNDIINGEKIIDVALKYGYDTHNGFSKAFKRKFDYSPRYLTAISFTETVLLQNGGSNMTHIELYNEIKETLSKEMNSREIDLLEKAYQFASEALKDVKRYSGEDYIIHPVSVAHILSEMYLPIDFIVLGLLHDCNEKISSVTLDDVRNVFGDIYYNKLLRFNELNMDLNLFKNIDIEKEEDIALVKLADRLHNMMTLKHLNESKWIEKAEETLRIFSPLAGKIKNTKLKSKLDSLSIQFINSK